jgi:hypothetical protein
MLERTQNHAEITHELFHRPEIEYYLLIKKRIQKYDNGSEIVRSWDEYFKEACRNSYGLRSRINSERPLWTTNFLAAFDGCTSGLTYLTNLSTMYDKFSAPPVSSQKH